MLRLHETRDARQREPGARSVLFMPSKNASSSCNILFMSIFSLSETGMAAKKDLMPLGRGGGNDLSVPNQTRRGVVMNAETPKI